MRWRWLGWAGVELEHGDATLVIDPLADPAAVFAAAPPESVAHPAVVAPTAQRAVAGLLTHLHRDHADAVALGGALRPGAPVLEPESSTGEGLEVLGLAQAEAELAAAGLPRRRLRPWERVEHGPFAITALPAVDGLGDPQVSWLVEAGGQRIVHLGDTTFHGGLWSVAMRGGPIDVLFAPVNGAVVRFPHRRPAVDRAIVMDPPAAAQAARILGARLTVPVHAEGYAVDGVYRPCPDPQARFLREAAELELAARAPELGAWSEVAA